MYNIIYDPHSNIPYDINSVKGINVMTEYLNKAFTDNEKHCKKKLGKKKRKKKSISKSNTEINNLDFLNNKIKLSIETETEKKKFIKKLNDTIYNAESILVDIKKYLDN